MIAYFYKMNISKRKITRNEDHQVVSRQDHLMKLEMISKEFCRLKELSPFSTLYHVDIEHSVIR